MTNVMTSQASPSQASRVFDFGEQCGAVDLDDGSRAKGVFHSAQCNDDQIHGEIW
jgi:hypothetical protein